MQCRKGQFGSMEPMSWKTEVIASSMVLGSEAHLSKPVFSSVKLVDSTGMMSKLSLTLEFP